MAIAAAAVNQFQTVTQVVDTSLSEVYEAPVGFVGVVLLAQCTNLSSETQTITFVFRRGGTDTELLKDFPIPGNETAQLITGKLVLETGDKLVTLGSSATDLKFVTSILETTNI